jgi:hypothetical protein
MSEYWLGFWQGVLSLFILQGIFTIGLLIWINFYVKPIREENEKYEESSGEDKSSDLT